jgi:REP element-mobilizing transposase RayT
MPNHVHLLIKILKRYKPYGDYAIPNRTHQNFDCVIGTKDVSPENMNNLFGAKGVSPENMGNLFGAKGVSPLHKNSSINGTSGTIGSIIRGFKIGVTKWCRKNTDIYDVWQRSFYDRIIRSKEELIATKNIFIKTQRIGKKINSIRRFQIYFFGRGETSFAPGYKSIC